MGQKRGELGEAIRNLAYQAGEYDEFYDLFGDSGAATAALVHLEGKKYVYNEVNPRVFALFSMLSSAKYKELFTALKKLQKYIGCGNNYPEDKKLRSDAEWCYIQERGSASDEIRRLMFKEDKEWRCLVCLYYLYYNLTFTLI